MEAVDEAVDEMAEQQSTTEGEGSGGQQSTFRSRMETRMEILTEKIQPLGQLSQQLSELNLLVRTFMVGAPTQQQLKDGLEERVRQDLFLEVMRTVNARLERLEGTWTRLAPWISIALAAAAMLLAARP